LRHADDDRRSGSETGYDGVGYEADKEAQFKNGHQYLNNSAGE